MGDDGSWSVSEAGYRLFAELQNLRRSMDIPLGEALKLIRRYDGETGLYREEDGDPREWKRRWETAREEILQLRERLERQEGRVARERELMAGERQWMSWERMRWHQLVWQMSRALTLASQPASGSSLAHLLEESRARRAVPSPPPAKRVSLWQRIFRPETMRRAA